MGKRAALRVLLVSGAVLILFFSFGSRIPMPGAGAADLVRLQETDTSLEYNYDVFAGFCVNPSTTPTQGGGFFFYTKDGIKYMTASGEVWLDVPYSMTRPVASGAGGVAAVSDRGKDLYVFDTRGLLYSKQFEHTIVNFFVNSAGASAVLLDAKNLYRSQIFSAKGEEVFTYEHRDKNIFPAITSVSDDGKICVLGFLDINGTEITSSLYFGDIENQRIFSSLTLDKQMLLAVKFLGDQLIAVTDAGLSGITLDTRAGETRVETSVPINNRIDMLSFFGEKGFVIALGDALPGQEQAAARPSGTLLFFDAQCSQTGEYSLGAKAALLRAAPGRVIAGANHTYYAFNAKGELSWRYDAVSDLKDLLPLDADTVLVVTDTGAKVAKAVQG
ncbi:MAG: DUF5711 family protein [Clostridiales bacterium]|nr:DUF5711 family protein [Clostridiales bacterium]